MTAIKKTAMEWLLETLTKEEQIEVLKYIKDRLLENDNDVYFIVRILKLFSTLTDKNTALMVVIDDNFKKFNEMLADNFTASFMGSKARIEEISKLIDGMVQSIASQNHMLTLTTGKLDSLIERFDIVSKGSVQFFEAMRGLKSDFSGNSIVDLLNEEAGRAAQRNWREVSKYFERKEVVDHLLEFLKMSVQTAIIIVGVAVMHHWWK